MEINEAVAIAERLESLFRRSLNFGKDRQDILEEIWDMAEDMRSWAERLEKAKIEAIFDAEL